LPSPVTASAVDRNRDRGSTDAPAGNGGRSAVGPSGESSNRIVSNCVPETPSTMLWWIFQKIANSSAATPSMTTTSHSGRERSS
jgi:hypothetical protein